MRADGIRHEKRRKREGNSYVFQEQNRESIAVMHLCCAAACLPASLSHCLCSAVPTLLASTAAAAGMRYSVACSLLQARQRERERESIECANKTSSFRCITFFFHLSFLSSSLTRCRSPTCNGSLLLRHSSTNSTHTRCTKAREARKFAFDIKFPACYSIKGCI